MTFPVVLYKDRKDLSDVVVDPEDSYILELWDWQINPYGYVERRTSYRKPDKPNPVGKRVFLHRQILQYKGPLTIDHIDGNPLNNSKSNLEIVTKEENSKRQVSRYRLEVAQEAA